LIVFSFSNFLVKENRNTFNATYSIEISSTPAKAIKLLAGEFSGLMADYLLLQIGSFIGSNSHVSNEQWETIRKGFDQAFELDPYFQQTYIQAQAFLAWDANMPRAAIKILDQASQKRPWDWMPGYYCAFDHYYFLNNFQKAADIFLETAKIKNSPVIIALLGSRFAIKDKRTQASINILELMLKDPGLDENNIKEISHRIDVLKSIDILDLAIDHYKRIFYVYPSRLEDLVTSKILARLPENPYKKEYRYNPDTGEISFD